MPFHRGPRRPGNATFGKSQQWLRLAAVLLVLALGAYGGWQQRSQAPQPVDRDAPPAPARTPPRATDESIAATAPAEAPANDEQPADARAPLPSPAPPAAQRRSNDAASRSSSVERGVERGGETRTTISNQTIRDLNGRVVYRGDVDVSETLARIAAGEQLPFPNDGSTFQNRERRLPRKPAGYYREYVHPTPGLRGPGPQRIVIGEGGETYYTADHYGSFVRLDAP